METFLERYYQQQASVNNTYFLYALSICMLLLVVSIGISYLYYSQPNARLIVNCSTFSSYKDAVRAYNMGAWNLDRNHNGVPCESLLP